MVQGVAEFKRRWDAIPQAVREAVRQRLEEVATDLVADMKRLVPRRTGTLADSIGWTWGDAPAGSMTIGEVKGNKYATMRIIVYAGDERTKTTQRRASGTRKRDRNRSGTFDSNYARYVEFGTVKMAPRPFFYPVWRVRRRGVRSKITRALNKAIKES